MDMKKSYRLLDCGAYGSIALGVKIDDGVTVGGYEMKLVSSFTLDDEATPYLFMRTANGIFLVKTSMGDLYYGTSTLKKYGDGFSYVNCFVDYHGQGVKTSAGALILGDNIYMQTVTTSGVTKLDRKIRVYSAEFHCGRLFYVDTKDKFMISWTGLDSVTDTESGLYHAGNMKFQDRKMGEAIRLIEFDGALIAVRKYGFSKLQFYGAAENFAVKQSDAYSPSVNAQTVVPIGGKLYFFTVDGIYTYDGTDIERFDVEEVRDMQVNCAVGWGSLYIVSGTFPKLGFQGVVCIDVEKKSCSYVKTDALLLSATDNVYGVSETGIYKLNSTTNYDWKSGTLTFDDGVAKYLKSVTIPSRKKVTLTVTSEHGERVYKNVSGRVAVNMRGTSFVLRVNGQCEIADITLEVCF
jgi:hypothetical protein